MHSNGYFIPKQYINSSFGMATLMFLSINYTNNPYQRTTLKMWIGYQKYNLYQLLVSKLVSSIYEHGPVLNTIHSKRALLLLSQNTLPKPQIWDVSHTHFYSDFWSIFKRSAPAMHGFSVNTYIHVLSVCEKNLSQHMMKSTTISTLSRGRIFFFAQEPSH